jgi:hypothetical protein
MLNKIATYSIAIALTAGMSATAAVAQTATDPTITEDRGIQDKQKSDAPGASTDTGTTANPTAKPSDSSIAGKQKTDAGVKNAPGETAAPAAKPKDSSLTEKQSKDQANP